VKKLLYLILIAIILAFAPILPQEKEVTQGVVVIEHESIYDWYMKNVANKSNQRP